MRDNPAPARGVLGIAQDEAFRLLAESVSDYSICLLDAEGTITSWSRGGHLIEGYAPGEIIGQTFSVLHPEDAIAWGEPHRQLETAKHAGRVEAEGWYLRKGGEPFWAHVVITAIRDEHERLLGFSRIARERSEQRAHEENVSSSDERLRLLVDAAQEYAIFVLDVDGRVATWNPGAQRIKGYRAEEIIGRHFSAFYPAEALARGWPARELEEATRVGKFEEEGWRLRKDGSRFWANVVITALRDAKGELRGFSKITRDLTQRRLHEERLRESEESFRLLLEGVEDYAVYMLDPQGRVTSWNTGAERITGYRADEIVGRSFEILYTRQDVLAGLPADELRKATLNRRAEDLRWRVRKDGTRFWADVVVTSLVDAEGILRGFAQVTRDLSERKRIEELEEEGRHLTEFLAMLAHELRNPLAPIRNAVAIMSMHKDVSPQVAWARDVIERQTAQLVRLVDDLLDVSRITRGKLRLQSQSMDLRSSVHRAIEGARPLIEARKHELLVELPAEAVIVHGDDARLTQVVLNLLNNAAKYTPEGGRIRIALTEQGNDAVLCVRDDGIGISQPMLERVFELFTQGERTLDRAEGGLGIGLTLTRRIVTLHGGRIVARSQGPGEGSEFEVRLPLMKARPPLPPVEGAASELRPAARTCSILVVDDNVDAAASVAALLRLVGHEVQIEHDGSRALDRISELAPDIVLLDIEMPGMSGYEVARALRARPEGQGLRIFAMTGHGLDEHRRRSLESGFDGHLVKPVLPADLLSLIESTVASD